MNTLRQVDDDGYADKQRMRALFNENETMRDFLEWLFEAEIDYMTQSEAFELYQQSLVKKPD